MWIVRIALSRPYTFLVLALLIMILGPLSIMRMPTDIFPNINIPVVSVLWTFTGMTPQELGDRLTANFERAVTTTVDNIQHIESQSMLGISVTKLFFQPGINVDLALSQTTAISQTLLRAMPPGTLPPQVLSYNASSVPVIQLVLSSPKLSEQELNDLGNNFIRTQLATVQGAALPFPYGGKTRQIQVDLNQQAMQTYGVSPQDVNAAIDAQNLILPAGTEKIGQYEYYVKLNASPILANEMNDLPLKRINNTVLYIHDVAHVRDGFAPQTNIVRVNGVRAVLMNVEKTGSASTVDIVNRVKEMMPAIRESMPPALNISTFSDQSIFVKAAIAGVIREAVIAACLTGLMILLFLGSWRSTMIITVSIPLSILTSITVLSALGETINIMTLGGLALAVGILVDDATVTIENINWNLEQGKEVQAAILDGAQQIAVPALVSTLCICIVFLPMFFLQGVSHFLFTPLAEAVIFAMLASYILSRTLVPTLAMYWLKKHEPMTEEKHTEEHKSLMARIYNGFNYRFEVVREHYKHLLKIVLNNSKTFIIYFLGFLFLSCALLIPWLGSDFFPTVDAGQIKLHVSAPTGTRVEETAKLCDEIDGIVRQVIPADEVDGIVDNIGLPVSGINLSYSNSGTIGPEDADILVSLKSGHGATDDYIRQLRTELNRKLPGVTFSFLPADIVNQILNFGLPSPINIQVVGFSPDNPKYAFKLLDGIKHISGVVDARISQKFNYPELKVNVDRTLTQDLGFTQFDVASDMLISLSGSFQTTPTFWLSEKGVSYPVVTQTPQYDMDSLHTLKNIPITRAGVQPQILGALSTISLTGTPAVATHYNVQPVVDIYASVEKRDLGGVASDIESLISASKKDLPRGSSVIARGQMQTQKESFHGLYAGLLFAIVLVYLLIVVNFQSWTDPFIIITALPAAIAGIAWMLFLTHTTISVPALTGAIMCMGIATANSILVVSFARQNMDKGEKPAAAALDAGYTRLRPVFMTAFAMIIGMLPMALGMGEGGEQNAPLGRAVIGGLIFATTATLFFVPAVFNLIHGRKHTQSKLL